MNKGKKPFQDCFDKNDKILVNNLGQFVLIDWLEFTIHYDFDVVICNYDMDKNRSYITTTTIENRVYQLFNDLFGISKADVNFEYRGRNGYSTLYYYKNIQFWCSTDVLMGIHIEISGQGCRDIEQLKNEWIHLLSKIVNYKYKITRIDLSLDDFTNHYYTLKKIKRYLRNNQVITKLRTFYDIDTGIVEDYKLLGSTVQLGSKAGLIHITFYDKLQERYANNYDVNKEIKYWTRTELRFRNEKAIDVVDYIIKGKPINEIIKGVLCDYVRFLEKSKTDNNKGRWKTSKWWLEFIDNIEKLQLAPVKVYNSIHKKKVWLNETVSKTQLMVLISTLDNIKIDNLSTNFILDMLKGSINKLKEKDLLLINDYRLENDLIPLTIEDIENYIRSIKDVLLINNQEQD